VPMTELVGFRASGGAYVRACHAAVSPSRCSFRAGVPEAAFRDAPEDVRPPSPERDAPRDSVAAAADGSRT
jgi:hypothetical protein